MSVTEYLERARECAEIADRMTGPDKAKLMKIADVWLELARDAATIALKTARDRPHRSYVLSERRIGRMKS